MQIKRKVAHGKVNNGRENHLVNLSFSQTNFYGTPTNSKGEVTTTNGPFVDQLVFHVVPKTV